MFLGRDRPGIVLVVMRAGINSLVQKMEGMDFEALVLLAQSGSRPSEFDIQASQNKPVG